MTCENKQTSFEDVPKFRRESELSSEWSVLGDNGSCCRFIPQRVHQHSEAIFHIASANAVEMEIMKSKSDIALKPAQSTIERSIDQEMTEDSHPQDFAAMFRQEIQVDSDASTLALEQQLSTDTHNSSSHYQNIFGGSNSY